MVRSILLIFCIAFSVTSSRGATQMTPHQIGLADEVVGKQISAIQGEIMSQPSWATLKSSIAELAERKKEWQSNGPASAVGNIVQECRDRHVPVPASINEKVVDDIIWQFQNAYGTTPLDRKRHQASCAWALGQIGDPKGVPFIIQALAQAGEEHTPWLGLVGVADERLIPAIEKYLDFNNHQPALPAIASLAQTGEKAIPVLQRFLDGNDRALREAAVDALVRIGEPSCIPVLKNYLNINDTFLKRKIQYGILQIQCRTVDEIYTPPSLLLEDEARVWHLVEVALLSEQQKERLNAANVLVDIGAISVGILRKKLENPTHFDYIARPPEYFVSQRAADILKRIGTPALPALIDALCSEHQVARIHATEALQQLTGQKFGATYSEWSRWFLNRKNQ